MQRFPCWMDPLSPSMRALYSRYLPLVRGQVERILRPVGGAETVVLEVFLRYDAERRNASARHDPIVHLYRLSTRLALHALRAPRRRRGATPMLTPTYETAPAPEILAALRSESQENAELLALYHLAEMSFNEIGETLGMPPQVVAQRLQNWQNMEDRRGP